MLQQISFVGFRGASAGAEFGDKTLIVGPNGGGKSRLIEAACLAVLGYIPGRGKTAGEIMALASGNPMMLQATVDGHKISRTFIDRGGKVSTLVTVDGVDKGNVDQAIGKNRIVDGSVFWSLSSRLQRLEMIKAVSDDPNVESVLESEATAREILNAARARRTAAEDGVTQLATSERDLVSVAGTVASISAKLKGYQDREAELVRSIGASDENERERKRLLSLVDVDHTARLAELTHAAKQNEALEQTRTAACERARRAYDEARRPVVPEAARADIVAARDICIEYVHVAVALENAAKLLQPWTVNEAHTPEAVAAAGMAFDQAQDDLTWCKREAVRISGEVGKVREKIAEQKRAASRLEKLGASTSQEDRASLEGVTKARQDAQTQLGLAQRADTIRGQLEKQRLVAEKLRDEETAAKAALAVAADARNALLTGVCATLQDRMRPMLPKGLPIVRLDQDDVFIGLALDGSTRSRAALSGGERAIFDAAFLRAMAGPRATIFVEAGECSNATIEAVMRRLRSGNEGQLVLVRWTDASNDIVEPAGWTKISV